MELIIICLGYTSLIWVITNFVNIILTYFKLDKYEKYVCLYCWSFWLVLLYTFDPFTAAISSLLGYIIDKYLIEPGIEI